MFHHQVGRVFWKQSVERDNKMKVMQYLQVKREVQPHAEDSFNLCCLRKRQAGHQLQEVRGVEGDTCYMADICSKCQMSKRGL